MPSTPFRLTAPLPSEDALHQAVAKALRFVVRAPAVVVPYPAGWVQLTAAQAAKYARMGMPRGMPDWLLWYGGASFGIELKRPRLGRLSEAQEEMFPRLANAGMTIAVCRSLEDVMQALDNWAIPTRGRISA